MYLWKWQTFELRLGGRCILIRQWITAHETPCETFPAVREPRPTICNLPSVICHLSFGLPRCFFDVGTKWFTKPIAAMSLSSQTFDGIEIRGPIADPFPEILTPDALRFVARLQREFNGRRKELLERRERRQAEINQGKKPDFLPETAHYPCGGLAGGANSYRSARSSGRNYRAH